LIPFKTGIKATPVEWHWMEDKMFRERLVAGSAVARVLCQVMPVVLAFRPGDVVIAAE